MIRLVDSKQPKNICVRDMKDGDIGVITGWTGGHYIGNIVQRYKDNLLVVGAASGNSWSLIFGKSMVGWGDCRVRLLEKGEMLIVE